MIATMFLRQSRLLYSLFHNVDTVSKKHGGQLVAQVLKSHGVDNIFSLAGGHVSPIIVASDQMGIRIVDVRHEATAVFAADASARLTGIPGVAVVTAGPGLTNTVTAIKNAQMAESPVVIIGGAAATMLKGRGSLQDIDQISLLKSATKKCYTIDCVRDIAPTLREAFRVAQNGTPGPVFVETPIDILYPYQVISQQFTAMRSKKPSIMGRIIDAYSNYSLNHIFADAWKDRDLEPLPISAKQPNPSQLQRVVQLLERAKRPLIICGSQAVLRPYGPEGVARDLLKLGIPTYLSGSARGLLGTKCDIQFKHGRKDAIKESDLVILLGAVCDFRLGYGSVFKRTKVVSVNRSSKAAKLNAGIFWKPTVTLECDIGRFVENITLALRNRRSGKDKKLDESADDDDTPLMKPEPEWLDTLKKREHDKDASIENMATQPTDKHLNPLKLLLEVRRKFEAKDEEVILVADGGDFVGSAAYIMRPGGPLRWLDPGPFGTLGCGAGFALAAKLARPKARVLCLMGDGAFGYAIPELDTFVRHKVPVFWLIGNDACWTQICREQEPMLGSPAGCMLAYTDYHKVAEGFGAKGMKLDADNSEELGAKLAEAKREAESSTVVCNALIGKTKFRDGSISV